MRIAWPLTALALVAGASAAAAEPMATESMAAAAVAVAEPAVDAAMVMARRWPSVPDGHGLSLEDQIVERLTELGNRLGHRLDLLSHDALQLQVDGRNRRAHLRIVGGGDRLTVRVDGDFQLDDANACFHARIDLAFHGHAMTLELPELDVAPAALRGDYGVELKLPLFVRKF